MRIRRQRRAANPRSFDEFAATYDRRDELTRGWVTAWLVGQLEGRRGRSAIDLGCGNGNIALILADHYETVRAVDISAEMIRLASTRRSHPRVVYEQADINLVTGQYDLVLSILVLHHMPDITRTLAHIADLVAPGGAAILVDPAEPLRKRWQFHLGNLKWLYGDLRSGQPNAFEAFRLRSDRRWMDHLVSDRFLTAEQFREVYARALPGAAIGPASGYHYAIWHRPGADSAGASAERLQG